MFRRYAGRVANEFDYDVAWDFGTALLLGALIGIEREKRNEREGFGTAGLRSFILLAQLGAIGGFLSKTLVMPSILLGVLFAAAATVVAGYLVSVRQRPESVGLTTEIAAIVTCLLGALATTGYREFAVGLAVLTAALLAYKKPLHALVGKLGSEDVLVGMRFLLATFIVLPLLKNEALDPWGAINLYKLWLLVLLISGMSLVGYVATRWLGPGRGIAVTAATGGLVSSTATTLALARQSREAGHDAKQLAGGILLSWAIMFARVGVTAAVVGQAFALRLLPALVPMAIVCALFAWRGLRRDGKDEAGPEVPMKIPFSLLAASKLAVLFAVVQLLMKLAQEYLPQSGTYAVAALAGLTDVDAVTLTMAERGRGGAEGADVAVIAIVVACLTNTAVKAGISSSVGKGLGRHVVLATVVVAVAGVVGLFFV
jgi:uncharacterized membrane protein (DUF4010 family)